MGNKKRVNELMYELQNCLNETYIWEENGNPIEIEKLNNRIAKIRQEVLSLVTD